MKNLETIKNCGEDAVNCIACEPANEIEVIPSFFIKEVEYKQKKFSLSKIWKIIPGRRFFQKV